MSAKSDGTGSEEPAVPRGSGGDSPPVPAGVSDDVATAAAAHGESSGLRQRVAGGLRREAAAGEAVGGRAAVELGHATEAMALGIVPTALSGERVLVGHVLGMHISLPAEHLHGPRQAPALLYLFADALAIRPTDDAPMSTVPIFGLHMALPPLAIARWVYKAGRIEHANADLVKDAERFAASLAEWTVDDFAEADPKLEVHRALDLPGALHVYEHLGFANLAVPVTEGRRVHLRSTLPASSQLSVKLWQLFASVDWPHGLSTEALAEPPWERHEDAPGAPAGGDSEGR